ncbi:OstA-like protein [Verrucomicrobiia bacterium DG1235]|nr:OstA-like protein [Verrucomicrobiae bacterium DG1235]
MRAKAPLTILLSCLAAVSSFAQIKEKPQIATEIESVRLQVENDGENAYFHFSEAVLLKATNMTVECDSLEVFATREAEEQSNIGKFSAIKEIIASGNVRIVQAERTATCQKAVVKPNEERIVLSGNPVVVQPGGRIVTYNPEDEILLDRGNGRISIITKGPRKLRLTSSAITDLGFEDQGPVPTPTEETDEETPAETELTEAPTEPATPEPETVSE